MSATATPSDADLWPEDLEPKGEPSPASILRQQGYRLGERTEQVVFGEVESRYTDGKFVHTMYLSAPYLRFRQPIVGVEHEQGRYPATVFGLTEHGNRFAPQGVRDAAALKDQLREHFKNGLVTSLIESLVDQARDLDNEAETG